MLNAHSQIAFPPETHFVRHYLSGGKKWEDIRCALPGDPYLSNMQLDLNELAARSSGALDFYTKCMRSYAASKGKQCVGDKDPKNIESIKTIRFHFPGALVVHMYRDPRAVIASRMKAEWSKDKPLWQHILAYKAQFNYMKKNATLFTGRYIEVQYETLLSRPRQVLADVLALLGLEFEQNMLSFFKHSDEVVKGKEKRWKENLYKPVMQENINKWKNSLTERQIQLIESALYPEMRGNGYEYSSKNPVRHLVFSAAAAVYCRLKCS